jgi:hypothetical protein
MNHPARRYPGCGQNHWRSFLAQRKRMMNDEGKKGSQKPEARSQKKSKSTVSDATRSSLLASGS